MTRTELLISVAERKFDLSQTLLVLKANINIFFSWGVSSLKNFEDQVLILKVNGHHHKGLVLISLAWDDTYTVTISSIQNNVKKTYKEVYFDMLVDIIDTHIEKVPEYEQ